MLREEPLCQHCYGQGHLTAAGEVDHIVAKGDGGTDERANLQGLFRACHEAKTVRERALRAEKHSAARLMPFGLRRG